MKAADENWPEVVENLMKARKSWARMARIMGREGSKPRVLGMLFKVVVQSVLLFGSEMWVPNPRMGRDLSSFQHGVTRCITRKHLKRRDEGG